MASLDAIARDVLAIAAVRGVDIVHPMAVGWYNEHVRTSDPARQARMLLLPEHGRGDACGALVIGNTGGLWEPFLKWAAGAVVASMPSAPGDGSHPTPEAVEAALPADPLDGYCRAVIGDAVDAALQGTGVGFDIFWSWSAGTGEAAGKLVPLQRAAEAAGLAALDHNTHLCIHPEYGPWLSLRAVVVLDVPFADGAATALPPPPTLPPLMTPDEVAAAQETLAAALAESGTDAAEMCRTMHGVHTAEWPWRKWVALRDCPRRGRAHRFCDEQLRYHYTKDRTALARAVARFVALRG